MHRNPRNVHRDLRFRQISNFFRTKDRRTCCKPEFVTPKVRLIKHAKAHLARALGHPIPQYQLPTRHEVPVPDLQNELPPSSQCPKLLRVIHSQQQESLVRETHVCIRSPLSVCNTFRHVPQHRYRCTRERKRLPEVVTGLLGLRFQFL